MSTEGKDGDSSPHNFIEAIIRDDLKTGRVKRSQLKFRFPPEPNGYLHLGHVKAICLNQELAEEFQTSCHLRFDDTNPTAEEDLYLLKIVKDLTWLGFLERRGSRDLESSQGVYHASDWFAQLLDWARMLIRADLAYVCDLTPEQISEYRGGKVPGKPCPGRARKPNENLELFERMIQGEFPDGSRTLRAKIDLNSANMNLRDPIIYRIFQSRPHHQTGFQYKVYPTYDWAHGQCDFLEGISHSLCTLEYENHRPLYNWFLEQIVKLDPELSIKSANNELLLPIQREFAPLSLSHTILSKRKLRQLIESGLVSGWDDPRMPTLAGLRRRGVRPSALRSFCREIGLTKTSSLIEYSQLEHHLRLDLDSWAVRRMVVVDPIKLVITNYPNEQTEELEADNHPQHPEMGKRRVPFSRELWIEREDFREEAPRKYFRLKPGIEVRLRYAYYITCTGCVKDPVTGQVIEVQATYDPATRGGQDPGGRKVKGTIHWVSAQHSVPAVGQLINRMFSVEDPVNHSGDDWMESFDPDGSLIVKPNMQLERGMGEEIRVALDHREQFWCQFERQGFFCLDIEASSYDQDKRIALFNRTVGLRDTWGKIEGRGR